METVRKHEIKMNPLEMSEVQWEYEDELPEMSDEDFNEIYKASKVIGVRVYPYVEDSQGNRIWITNALTN